MVPSFNKIMTFNRYNLGFFNSGTYYPFICDVISVSHAQQAIVETNKVHGFEIGNTVQFFIPQEYGMRQLNGCKSTIISIPSDHQIQVNINTLGFDSFNVPMFPPLVVKDPAQVAGIGDINFGRLSPGGIPILPLTIPGAFLNRPP